MTTDEILTKGIVYGAMHDDGRWYIGSTSGSVVWRKHCHYGRALNDNEASHTRFHTALRSTSEDEWIWGVHEEFVQIRPAELLQQEANYQKAFGSVGTGGYNHKLAVSDPEITAIRVKASYDKEKQKFLNAAYRAANRPRLLAKAKAKYHANPELFKSRSRTWRQQNPEAFRDSKRRHREKQAAKCQTPASQPQTFSPGPAEDADPTDP